MTRFWLLAIPASLFVIQTVLSLPKVSAEIGINETEEQVLLGLVMIALFAASQWLTILRPYKRFERFERTKRALLERDCERLINSYDEVDLRINVMLVSIRRPAFLEPWSSDPGKKALTFKRTLSPHWTSPNMRQHSDTDVKFTVDQGVCGEAFRRKEAVAADLTVGTDRFNLSSDQASKAGKLKFVLSFPIRALDPSTLETTSALLGVVNLDSRTEGSESLIRDKKARQELIDRAGALSDLCSKLF